MKRSLVDIHLAVFLFGLAGLFGKLISASPVIIVLGRVLIAGIFLAILLALQKQSMQLKRRTHAFYLGLMGLILAVHWITFFQAIQLSTVTIGLISFSTFPIFVTFLEPLFFQEKLHAKAIILAGITFTGVVLVAPQFDGSNQMMQGVLWGVLSGLTFAFLAILNRKLVHFYPSVIIAFYQDVTATIILLPFYFLMQPALSRIDILWLLLLGVLFTGVAHSLFIKGLEKVPAQTASIIATLEPVYGVIFALILLGEMPAFRTILGGIFILGAAVLSSTKEKELA